MNNEENNYEFEIDYECDYCGCDIVEFWDLCEGVDGQHLCYNCFIRLYS